MLAPLRDGQEPDDDGDFWLDRAPIPAYVRVWRDRPLVTVFGCAVADLEQPDRAEQEVALLNRKNPLVRFSVRGDQVWAEATVPASPFVPRHLVCELNQLATMVAEEAPDLAVRLAGAATGWLRTRRSPRSASSD